MGFVWNGMYQMTLNLLPWRLNMEKTCPSCSNFDISGTADKLGCTKLTPNPFMPLHFVKDAKEFRRQIVRAEGCKDFEQATA